MTDNDQSLEPDAVMLRVGEGIGMSAAGDREGARRLLAVVWEEIGGEAGDALHRCAVAHSMADVQDDVQQELLWDLRALAAADLITDERAATGLIAGPVAGFYPSLHLNLGECYRKCADIDRARDHLRKGLAAMDFLADDGYSKMIRAGLERLEQRLE